ncbi:hypothetical protein [Marinigracilibium pacificum]|uniref:Lipocalin-like protein n=1 Tax=Marinigracilibium pacificum TaxID=2729599 RepID=A0A848J5Y1_9BACT|nr:hypothetical protein [Marinigracilibium pacificum]NMM50865.1 hypothetical protein [Marinigracilibium pacificum]
MKLKLIIITLLLSVQIISAQDNSLNGLWEITSVKVGDEQMTPIGKWTRINGDGTYESGNGWIQNGAGRWSFNKTEKLISLKDDYIKEDIDVPFSITFRDNEMIWERKEEGTNVKVHLKRIDELPREHAEKLVGVWEKVENKNEEILMLRWDRVFVKRIDGKQSGGYWHPHAHKPEIGFINYDNSKPHEYYQVEFVGDQLVLTGVSKEVKGKKVIYIRSN